MKKLIVIVPAFNEAETIAHTVKSLRDIADKCKDFGLELNVCVINDASVDATAENARQAGVDIIVDHKINRGLGAAVRTGLQRAKDEGASIVVKFDADLQHDPEDVIKIIQPIIRDESDVVYGNRFNKIAYKMPFVRNVGNKTFIWLMRWLTRWDIKDSQPGIFAVGSSYLQVFRLPGDYNYTQQILLDAFHKKMRFSQVEVSFAKREKGSSFISMKYPFKVLPQLFWVMVGVVPMRVFLPIAAVFFVPGVLVFLWQMVAHFVFGQGMRPVENVYFVLGSCLFGMQIFCLGVLAQLIVEQKEK